MYEASTIAKWFVAWAEAEEADLSNLKLQKLLYYAQGHHIATTGAALFRDEIQAWAHGPVVPAVYREYKKFESGDLHLDDADSFTWADVTDETTDFLLKVWNSYGGYAAWTLRNMTHAEPPWSDVFDFERRNSVITTDALRRHFATVR